MTPRLQILPQLILWDFQGLHLLHLQVPLPLAHAQLGTYHQEEPLKASLQTNYRRRSRWRLHSQGTRSTWLWQIGGLCTHMVTQLVEICAAGIAIHSVESLKLGHFRQHDLHRSWHFQNNDGRHLPTDLTWWSTEVGSETIPMLPPWSLTCWPNEIAGGQSFNA